MKTSKKIVSGLVAGILLSSYARIFYSPDAINLAQNHKLIAVVPPTVSIAARRKVDAESLKEQQKT